MKTVSAIIKTVVIFSIFMILLLALSVYLLLPKTLDAQRYASFVNKNSTKLAEIAEASRAEGFSPTTSERILLSRGKIDHVWSQENRVIFSIDHVYAPIEGYVYLVYQPIGGYIFPFDDPEWHPVDTGEESVLRWEGGNGYVNVTCLTDGFYLEYAYLPT